MKSTKSYLVIALTLVSSALATKAAASDHALELVISPAEQPGALIGTYRVGKRVTSIQFNDYDRPQRQANWAVLDSKFRFDGTLLARTDGKSFDEVTLMMKSDERFINRRYVAVDSIGSNGWTIFLPAILPLNVPTNISINGFAPNSAIRVGGKTIGSAYLGSLDRNSADLMYIGPMVDDSASIDVIAGPEIPDALVMLLAVELNQTIDAMTSLTGITLDQQPTLYLSSRSAGVGQNYNGGALDQGVITMRFRNINLDPITEELTEIVLNTLAHELVHLWVGRRFESEVEDSQPWLHEGSTEYIADRIRQTSEETTQEFEQRLSSCALRLKNRPLDGREDPVLDSAAYDCGYVLNYVLELASLQSGNSNVLETWTEYILRPDQNSFGPNDFQTAISSTGNDAAQLMVRLILADTSSDRWSKIAILFDCLWCSLARRSPDTREGDLLRAAMLMPILKAHCKGGYGYTTFEDYLELDTKERCSPPLNGNPSLGNIGDHNIMTEPFEAHTYATQRCREKASLELTTTTGLRLTLPACEVVIEELPEPYRIERSPNLPVVQY